MMEILRKIGATAGAKKCLREFKIPIERARRPMKKM
jgi:hypothetical protein